jgi:hypothetical protein
MMMVGQNIAPSKKRVKKMIDGKFFTLDKEIWQRTEDGEELLMGTMHDHVIARTFSEAMNDRPADRPIEPWCKRNNCYLQGTR